ncbi:hypothetical protein Tco_0102245, partial [Tanacetum coccineum]
MVMVETTNVLTRDSWHAIPKSMMEKEFVASSFVNKALTWWNTQVQERGYEAAIVTPESSRIKRYIAGLTPEIRGMLQATQPTIIHSQLWYIDEWKWLLVNAVRMGYNQRVCYDCCSPDHLHNTCLKMHRAPGQARNPLALEVKRNARN